jgi:hypothetical protein
MEEEQNNDITKTLIKTKNFCRDEENNSCKISNSIKQYNDLEDTKTSYLKHLFLFVHKSGYCSYGENCRNLLNKEHCLEYHLHLLAAEYLRKRNIETCSSKKINNIKEYNSNEQNFNLPL